MTEVPQRKAMCANSVRGKFVNIGSQKEQWSQVKSDKGCKSDEDVAQLLIKSLYQFEKQKVLLHPGSSAGRRKKRKLFKQDSCHGCRVLILKNDVWSQWHDLKHSLKIDCNSKLATVLINAWYDRAKFLKKQYDAQESEYTAQSGRDYIDVNTSVTDTGTDTEEYSVVKCEIEASQSMDDLEADKEINEGISHAKNGKTIVKMTEAESDSEQDFTERKVKVEVFEDEHFQELVTETSTQKPYRKRKLTKADYSQDVKCRKKRIKSNESESVKKPWVKIKLEDHPEKYRMENFGSFERKNRNSNLTEELYTCMICGRFKSTAKDIFEEHIEKHVNMVLECDLCDYVGRSELELTKHRLSEGHMNKGNKFMCDICGMVLYTRDTRLSHMGKEHDDPQFNCKFCAVKFTTRSKRRQHIWTVHAEVAQYCRSCKTDCQTLTLEEFRQHQENCKPGHQCQVCGVVLVSKDGLNSHLKATHMGVRKYQCQICPYAAKSGKRLREHVMAHTSVHPYSCDKCTFTCVQANQLKSHMRTHSGEKPFKCTQCNFAAAWNVQLKTHLSIHELESCVTCRQCDIVFKNDKALKMHEKKDNCVFKLLDAGISNK